MDGFKQFFAGLWNLTAPVRLLLALTAILSALVTFIGLAYVDYFDHRKWANDRVAANYKNVEKIQGDILQISLETLPSKATNDRLPSEEQSKELRQALARLHVALSSVDVIGLEMETATNDYRSSITNFTKALTRLSKDSPRSYSELLESADDWDKAAKKYERAVETRINSYLSTLWPST